MPSKNPPPRDPAKPARHYLRLAELNDAAVRRALRESPDSTLLYFSERHLRIAAALYSAGAPVNAVRDNLAAAAEHFTRTLRASRSEPLDGIPYMHGYLDALGAAVLTDRMEPCLVALREARFLDVKPWQKALLALFADAFEGRVTVPSPDLAGAPVISGCALGELLDAVRRREKDRFQQALQHYLSRQWAPAAERAAVDELQASPARYVGKWAVHPTATCVLMGGIPKLTHKAQQFLMSELVQ